MNRETSSAPRFDFISVESVFYYMVLINDGCILATVYFSSCTAVYVSPTEKKNNSEYYGFNGYIGNIGSNGNYIGV